MSIDPRVHELGPDRGTLRLRTYRQGIAARVGHDLVLEVASWRGTVVVPEAAGGAPSITVEIDLRSAHVVESTGGVKPLTDGDKEDIRRAMQKPLRIADHPVAVFRSTQVRVDGDAARIEGELALAGRSRPIELHVQRDAGGVFTGHVEILQSVWGIKPYTGFLGALRLRDAVDVDVSVSLPG